MNKIRVPCKCAVCQEILYVNWTDTRGIGACKNCSAPHIIIAFDGNGRPMENWPAIALTVSGLEAAQFLWKTQRLGVFSGLFDRWCDLKRRFVKGGQYSNLLRKEIINATALIKRQGRVKR